eukprot:scaffold408_cov71-Cylindrotheca_fusiformis.AAC.34
MSTKNTNKSSRSSNNNNKKKKQSVLDKIILAIRESPPSSSSSGVSRVAITKYLKSELDYDNANQIKLALKRGVSNGSLTQKGQSFLVTNDPPRASIDDEKDPLEIEDVAKGEGEEGDGIVAERGDTVTVQYVGKLQDKTVFDSAKKFEFVLGAGDVIKGWDQGLVGMSINGKRKLVVPSHLGYGKRGCAPDIPGNATLYFAITMKKIVKPTTTATANDDDE